MIRAPPLPADAAGSPSAWLLRSVHLLQGKLAFVVDGCRRCRSPRRRPAPGCAAQGGAGLHAEEAVGAAAAQGDQVAAVHGSLCGPRGSSARSVVMVTGAGPQAKVISSARGDGAASAAGVQLAAVPSPTTASAGAATPRGVGARHNHTKIRQPRRAHRPPITLTSPCCKPALYALLGCFTFQQRCATVSKSVGKRIMAQAGRQGAAKFTWDPFGCSIGFDRGYADHAFVFEALEDHKVVQDMPED
jgi:hypothetical protein